MARLPRLDLPGIPQHIVQRGNNRLPCFLDDTDRHRYLHLLRETLLDTGIAENKMPAAIREYIEAQKALAQWAIEDDYNNILDLSCQDTRLLRFLSHKYS